MSPLLSLASVLALLALTIAAVNPVTAHYTKISNSCAKLKISGTIADALWRGRSEKLGTGTFNTQGDTTATVQTNFGTVTVNLWSTSSSIVTKLRPSLVKNATFFGEVGIQGTMDSMTISCSPHIFGGCKDSTAMDSKPNLPPTYADLRFSC